MFTKFWEVRRSSGFYSPVNIKFHDYAKARESFIEMVENPFTVSVYLSEYVAKDDGTFSWNVVATFEAAPELEVMV